MGRNALGHQHRMHCVSSCPCFFLAFIGQERAGASASHALCVMVLVHLPRLRWAGTRSSICIACIVRHRACVPSSPSLGRYALVHQHLIHRAASCLCFFLAMIGSSRISIVGLGPLVLLVPWPPNAALTALRIGPCPGIVGSAVAGSARKGGPDRSPRIHFTHLLWDGCPLARFRFPSPCRSPPSVRSCSCSDRVRTCLVPNEGMPTDLPRCRPPDFLRGHSDVGWPGPMLRSGTMAGTSRRGGGLHSSCSIAISSPLGTKRGKAAWGSVR